MLGSHGGLPDQYAESNTCQDETGLASLAPPLPLPKNRSTGNLVLAAHDADRGRFRKSLEAQSSMDADAAAPRPLHMSDHEHGLGSSGLRRIRQQPPSSRNPTLPNSRTSSRSPSITAASRSTSMSAVLASTSALSQFSIHSPNFSEDLSRFPSESLHSFSFANQAEDLLLSRQTVLKRSADFIKDRMGWCATSTQPVSTTAACAKHLRDAEAHHRIDLPVRALLMRAGDRSRPADHPAALGSLTGPADLSGENVFEKQFSTHFSPAFAPPAALAPSARKSDSQLLDSEASLVQAVQAALPTPLTVEPQASEESSRRPTDESGSTAKTSPPASRSSLKDAVTESIASTAQTDPTSPISDLAQPFLSDQPICEEPCAAPVSAPAVLAKNLPCSIGPAVHGHTNRWVPAAQAIFTTEAKPPWTIIAANDLACLLFGVTKAEVRKMGILEVVQEERRAWLERKLLRVGEEDTAEQSRGNATQNTTSTSTTSVLLNRRTGITAQLLGKPNSRSQPQSTTQLRSQTVHGRDADLETLASGQEGSSFSRGVLLCGDVVPIRKRNGATGSASLWVKEKRVGLIWVLEEIHEDVAYLQLSEEGIVMALSGAAEAIWGPNAFQNIGLDVAQMIPRIPRQGIDPAVGDIDFAQTTRRKYFTCPNHHHASIPCTIEQVRGKLELRISTFPHMAGIVVVDPAGLKIRSSNSVFCGALFGFEKPDGMPIASLVPDFDKILDILTEEDDLEMLDGMVVPEHRFRRAAATLFSSKEEPGDAAAATFQPVGLPARHRDGSDLKIDIQMRIVQSERQPSIVTETVLEGSDEDNASGMEQIFSVPRKEVVLALWITYSRHLHAHARLHVESPENSNTATPLHQPSPGQTPPVHTPLEFTSDDEENGREKSPQSSSLSRQLKEAALKTAVKRAKRQMTPPKPQGKPVAPKTGNSLDRKATIDDYKILEDMGQGAYGQVKLARHKDSGRKVVLKYVTKRRILVDTWTRDRKLGTVPLEIHVLEYLRRPEFRHPNIVEMEGFFEDDVNYYIEMTPHGLPGLDLFDYIELRANMEESECRSIFVQVAEAIHFLHTVAHVVHRDIKDENVILDGEGKIKLIDFGSAAYIKSGPFDVFVGTIDYAAPEVLAGKPYGGEEQDVWALGILLYTIIYKENPFYSIDEIMDRDLRVPFTISDESIDLIRCMLNRDVKERYNIGQVVAHSWCKPEDSG